MSHSQAPFYTAINMFVRTGILWSKHIPLGSYIPTLLYYGLICKHMNLPNIIALFSLSISFRSDLTGLPPPFLYPLSEMPHMRCPSSLNVHSLSPITPSLCRTFHMPLYLLESGYRSSDLGSAVPPNLFLVLYFP